MQVNKFNYFKKQLFGLIPVFVKGLNLLCVFLWVLIVCTFVIVIIYILFIVFIYLLFKFLFYNFCWKKLNMDTLVYFILCIPTCRFSWASSGKTLCTTDIWWGGRHDRSVKRWSATPGRRGCRYWEWAWGSVSGSGRSTVGSRAVHQGTPRDWTCDDIAFNRGAQSCIRQCTGDFFLVPAHHSLRPSAIFAAVSSVEDRSFASFK